MVRVFILLLCLALVPLTAAPQKKGPQNVVRQMRTYETEHFRINYPKELQAPAQEIATILERLYPLYRDNYGITLPNKTEVIVDNGPYSGGWALAIQNTIAIWVNDFDYNRRGNPNWLENVVAHEYAHIVSISASFKMPSWMPYLQLGTFDHPNEKGRTDALYIYPSEVLPPWFFEGIAQYESSLNQGDSWDTHRDMILRSLSQSDSMLTWDNMSVFNPANKRSDSYENTYNHGFSLVKYIAETYGKEKIKDIVRASSKFGRINFDRSIKEVLGITGKELYAQWKRHLSESYTQEIDSLGTIVEGTKVNKAGFESWLPRFSPEGNRLFYLNNLDAENSRRLLLSASLDSLNDTTVEPRIELPVPNTWYDFKNDSSIIYASIKGKNSQLPHAKGGERTFNLFTYKLAADSIEKPKYRPRKDEKKLTDYAQLRYPVYSPDKNKLAAAKHHLERYYLVIGDSIGRRFDIAYPPVGVDSLMIRTIFSLDWSPLGDQIALSYIDRDNRKIGLYSLKDSSFKVLLNDGFDNRDPRFSRDGMRLYFSSDRSGVFNIYRLDLTTGQLEQLTNVVGGAFTPDVSADEKTLTFSNYTAEGYGINLIDSLGPLATETVLLESELTPRTAQTIAPRTETGTSRRYNHAPRKPIVIPTLISEEVLAEYDNPYDGVRQTKFGVIVGLMDPLAWINQGNSLTIFALSENPFKQFYNLFAQRDSNKTMAADFGVLFDSYVLPIDISALYFTRNIPSQNEFITNIEGADELDTTNYSLQPSVWQLTLQKRWGDVAELIPNATRLGIFTSYTKYEANVDIGGLYLFYDPATLYRVGALASAFSGSWSSRSEISPTNSGVKFQYDFNRGTYVDENEPLEINSKGKIVENYEPYFFHNFRLQLENSHPLLIIKAFDIRYQAGMQYALVPSGTEATIHRVDTTSDADLPQFFLPAMQVPGYAYYYQANKTEHLLKTDSVVTDTVYTYDDSVLVSGRLLFDVHLSILFPLTKGSINRKLGFIYFDQIYGVIHGGGAIAGKSFSDLKDQQFYPYVGAELRLSTQAFNSYPLAFSFRWDQGLIEPEPVGGARFYLGIGFSFDTWGIIAAPDGIKETPTVLKQLQH